MKKRYAAVIAAAIMVLGGCGKVTEPNDNEAPVKASTNSQSSNDTTVTDDETTSELDTETTAEQENSDFDSYFDYIIGDGAFGFDMYNNGHIRQSWDNRIEGAKYILKGMASPGTEEKALKLAVPVEKLNSLETEGFMTNMKFEDTKTFRVGSEKIDGNGVTLIGYENSFIFCISYFDENDEYCETCYYEFPIDLIPDLVDAVQYADSSAVTEPDDIGGEDITGGSSSTDVLDSMIQDEENNAMFVICYQGKYITNGVNTDKIYDIALEALSDEKTYSEKTEDNVDYEYIQNCTENGLLIAIIFDSFNGDEVNTGRTISIGQEKVVCHDIAVCGSDGEYKIYYEDSDYNIIEMKLPKEYADRLMREGLGI